MEISLRAAGYSDLDRLDPMVAAYHKFENIELASERRLSALLVLLNSAELGRIFLIERDGALAGYAALTYGFSIELGGRDAFVDELFLRPEHRGFGVGSMALARLLDAAEAEGVKAVHLEVARGNDAAKGLYRRLGFKARDRFHLMTRRLGHG